MIKFIIGFVLGYVVCSTGGIHHAIDYTQQVGEHAKTTVETMPVHINYN